MGVAILSDRVKPATDDEATPVCNHWAPRGDWRQRVGKEKSRNLRGPRWVATPVRESDDPIVARKGLTSLERRGSTVSVQASTPSLPPGLVPITETKRAMVAMCAEHAYAWEAYRRAGCGKSARPVRRGGVTGKASLCDSRPSLSTLLFISGLIPFPVPKGNGGAARPKPPSELCERCLKKR